MKKSSIILGKAVRLASRLKGGGSALPGLVVEKFDKNFLNDALSRLPRGVVVVSGTNGKTTTTKMISELLESQNLKVFTNKSGSNFTRGVISSIIGSTKGFKFNYDIAVIELDEAHAVKFVKQVKPDYSLLLNVHPDQVDRFGDITNTAKLLTEVAKATKKTVILNREDPLISSIAFSLPRNKKVVYYGYSKELAKYFSVDNELYKNKKLPQKSAKKPFVELQSFSKNNVTFSINQKSYSTNMSLAGAHNYLNSSGALATVLSIDRDANIETLLRALGNIKPAFGRGEKLNINNTQVELILVKNPVGFNISLKSQYDSSSDTMIIINNNYGDGVDTSWLNDVDFSILKNVSIVSGSCADEVALCLKKYNIIPDVIEPNISNAIKIFLKTSKNKQIFTNYTAMLEVRKILGKIDSVENVM